MGGSDQRRPRRDRQREKRAGTQGCLSSNGAGFLSRRPALPFLEGKGGAAAVEGNGSRPCVKFAGEFDPMRKDKGQGTDPSRLSARHSLGVFSLGRLSLFAAV